jgi:hypothetical protein
MKLKLVQLSGHYVSWLLFKCDRRLLTNFNQTENGQAGACGFVSDDTDYVVGLPMGFYNASMGMISPFCNQFVVLTNPADNATVTARVSDATNTPSSIVLSVGAISMINQGSPIGKPFFLASRQLIFIS